MITITVCLGSGVRLFGGNSWMEMWIFLRHAWLRSGDRWWCLRVSKFRQCRAILISGFSWECFVLGECVCSLEKGAYLDKAGVQFCCCLLLFLFFSTHVVMFRCSPKTETANQLWVWHLELECGLHHYSFNFWWHFMMMITDKK